MRWLVVLLLPACACSAPTPETAGLALTPVSASDPLAACAGRWILHGPRNILGRSTDQVLEIAPGNEGWTLRRTFVLNPGVGAKQTGAVPSRRTEEPGPIAVDGNRLVYRTALHSDGVLHEVRHTYRIDAGQLVFPAWVRHGGREWVYVTLREDLRIKTEDDPRVVPIGTATVTGMPLWKSPVHYSATTEPDPSQPKVEQFIVRLTQRDDDGAVQDVGRLVEHPAWGRGLYRSNAYLEAKWERLSAEEWAKIEVLPVCDNSDGK